MIKWIIKNQAKLKLFTALNMAFVTGIGAGALAIAPSAGTGFSLIIGTGLTVFYAILAYYGIRSELMDELMARLSSEEKENDSNHIDA